jgi:hypothetical protein
MDSKEREKTALKKKQDYFYTFFGAAELQSCVLSPCLGDQYPV